MTPVPYRGGYQNLDIQASEGENNDGPGKLSRQEQGRPIYPAAQFKLEIASQ